MTSRPPSEPLHLAHVLGSTKRHGRWTVPETVTVRQRLGSTDLDFTEAEFTAPVTTIDLDMIGGSVELRVPEDTVVECELQTTLASYEDHRGAAPAAVGTTVVVRGRAVWGSVEVRGPRTRRRGGR